MKQAVIQTGGKQYVVAQDQVLEIELVGDVKTLEFEPLLIFDEEKVQVGTPTVAGAKVTAEVVEPLFKGKKIKVFKFKAKKRVKTLTGHRQKYTQVKITSIGAESSSQSTSQQPKVKSKPAAKPSPKKATPAKATARKEKATSTPA